MNGPDVMAQVVFRNCHSQNIIREMNKRGMATNFLGLSRVNSV